MTYLVKYAENIALVDEILVNEKKEGLDLKSIPSKLLTEMCSTRLVGDQEWTDAERVEGSPLSSWFLEEMEIQPHNRGR